jgi:hypothetical protein
MVVFVPMMKIFLWILAGCAGVIVLIVAGIFLPLFYHHDLVFKRLNQKSQVDLSGVATITVPVTFKREAGAVNSGRNRRFGGDMTSLEYHLDEERLTFRFVQGQYNNAGGYPTYPVVLDVTFFPATVSSEAMQHIRYTTAHRFYHDYFQEDHAFSQLKWLPDINDADGLMKRVVTEREPIRWLLIHVNPATRVRLDFYAWQKEYELDVAERLLRDIARSVSTTAQLQQHFDEIKTFPERMARKREQKVEEIQQALAPLGFSPLEGGRVQFANGYVGWLSEDRTEFFLGKEIGGVTMDKVEDPNQEPPRPKLALQANQYQSGVTVDGLPYLNVAMYYWSQREQVWKLGDMQRPFPFEHTPPEVVQRDIIARFDDPRLLHFYRFTGCDLEFHADDLELSAFIKETAQYEADFKVGKIVQ